MPQTHALHQAMYSALRSVPKGEKRCISAPVRIREDFYVHLPEDLQELWGASPVIRTAVDFDVTVSYHTSPRLVVEATDDEAEDHRYYALSDGSIARPWAYESVGGAIAATVNEAQILLQTGTAADYVRSVPRALPDDLKNWIIRYIRTRMEKFAFTTVPGMTCMLQTSLPYYVVDKGSDLLGQNGFILHWSDEVSDEDNWTNYIFRFSPSEKEEAHAHFVRLGGSDYSDYLKFDIREPEAFSGQMFLKKARESFASDLLAAVAKGENPKTASWEQVEEMWDSMPGEQRDAFLKASGWEHEEDPVELIRLRMAFGNAVAARPSM